ncbi:MAG TPA: hypothetical protein PKO06_23870, partial [Candidatus Ozemobacteraceae bacterium]|nr:hypothetical protein [Candidatus Ozemobacteraceae bacterium]
MKQIKGLVVLALLMAVAIGCEASALLVTCEVGGAKLERYNETTHRWDRIGGMPYLITVQRYEYVMIRVTAAGFKEFEKGYEVRTDGTTRAHVVLEPENDNPTSTSLFSIGGQVTRKSGMSILRGQYTMMARNMTTYRSGTGQMAHDENPIEDDGWYTCTWA